MSNSAPSVVLIIKACDDLFSFVTAEINIISVNILDDIWAISCLCFQIVQASLCKHMGKPNWTSRWQFFLSLSPTQTNLNIATRLKTVLHMICGWVVALMRRGLKRCFQEFGDRKCSVATWIQVTLYETSQQVRYPDVAHLYRAQILSFYSHDLVFSLYFHGTGCSTQDQ